jgi:hypothetical protein
VFTQRSIASALLPVVWKVGWPVSASTSHGTLEALSATASLQLGRSVQHHRSRTSALG